MDDGGFIRLSAQRRKNGCRVTRRGFYTYRTKGSIVCSCCAVRKCNVVGCRVEGFVGDLDAMLYDAGANVAAKRKFAAIQWAAL